MAEVNVDSWDGLVTALTTGTEDTTINLTKDIDLNDEYPEGIARVEANQHNYTINGNGYAIRNALLPDNSSSGMICGGYVRWITFINISLENWTAENKWGGYGANAYVFSRVAFFKSDISIKLIGNENFTVNTSTPEFFRMSECSVRVEGHIGIENIGGRVAFEMPVDTCHFTLIGSFYEIKLRANRCYIDGEFEVYVSNYSDYINFNYSYLTVITATINTDQNITNSNGAQCAIDTSVITTTRTISSNFIQCDTEQIKSPEYLASQGFVIVPEVVGGS